LASQFAEQKFGLSRARVSVSKSGVRTSGVLNFDVRYARALTLDVVCTLYAGQTFLDVCRLRTYY